MTAIDPTALLLFIAGLMTLAVIGLGGLALFILAIVAFFKRRHGLGVGLLLGGLALWFGPPMLALGARVLATPRTTLIAAWSDGPRWSPAVLDVLARWVTVAGGLVGQIAGLVAFVSGIATVVFLITRQRRAAMLALRSLGICFLIVVIAGAVTASVNGWSMSVVALALGLSIGAGLVWISVRYMPSAKQPVASVSSDAPPSPPIDAPTGTPREELRKMEAMDAG
ncbi:MAG: hypothetical protein AAGK09_09030 [Planctomycetota bacterium]